MSLSFSVPTLTCGICAPFFPAGPVDRIDPRRRFDASARAPTGCEDSAGSRASLRPWRVDYHRARRSAVLERRQQRNSPGDLCLNTEGQPSDLPAYVFRRPRELTLDRFSSLLEVLPALVVDGDGNARSDEATQLDRMLRRQRVAHGPSHRKLHASKVEECHFDLQAVRDLPHAVVKHGVPGDPNHAVLLAGPAEGEADHVARERSA